MELASLFTGHSCASDVAATGSIGLAGGVDCVAGLGPKLTGALRHGMATVVLPSGNVKEGRVVDIDEGRPGSVQALDRDPVVPLPLSPQVCNGLAMFAVDSAFDALDLVLRTPHGTRE